MRIELAIERLEQVVGVLAKQLGSQKAGSPLNLALKEILEAPYCRPGMDGTIDQDIERLSIALDVIINKQRRSGTSQQT